jgi:hypothetical protein
MHGARGGGPGGQAAARRRGGRARHAPRARRGWRAGQAGSGAITGAGEASNIY